MFYCGLSHQYEIRRSTTTSSAIADKTHDGFCAFKKIEFFVLTIVFSDSFADGVLITLIFFLNFYFRVNQFVSIRSILTVKRRHGKTR